MVEVEEGREFRFHGDMYSQESTFPLVANCYTLFTFRGLPNSAALKDGGRPGQCRVSMIGPGAGKRVHLSASTITPIIVT